MICDLDISFHILGIYTWIAVSLCYTEQELKFRNFSKAVSVLSKPEYHYT
jgi:hypothetical protein